MDELAITVVGSDRPGIIARVTSVLADLGLNLTDSVMTRLRGHFAMTLVCAGPATAQAAQEALEPVCTHHELLVTVRALPPQPPGPQAGLPYTVTVHGADRLGIVAAVTGVLAQAGGNITDLTTRLTGTLYLLSAEVDLPPTVDPADLAEELRTVGDRLGVEVNLTSAEADLL